MKISILSTFLKTDCIARELSLSLSLSLLNWPKNKLHSLPVLCTYMRDLGNREKYKSIFYTYNQNLVAKFT